MSINFFCFKGLFCCVRGYGGGEVDCRKICEFILFYLEDGVVKGVFCWLGWMGYLCDEVYVLVLVVSLFIGLIVWLLIFLFWW